MKKIITTIALALASLSAAYSQVTSYSIYGDSIPGCTNTVLYFMQNGVNPETGGILTVDWGDGTIDTHNFTMSNSNDWMSISMTHGYSIPGNYNVLSNVYSTTAGANVDAGQTTPIQAVSASTCGYVYSGVYQNLPYANYQNAPVDFTDANGIVTTINPMNNPGVYVYQGLNPANAPYTVSVNDAWLLANGLTQVTPDFTINSFNSSGLADISQAYFEVTCAIGAANPDFSIQYAGASNFNAITFSGYLYLDVCNLACANTSDVTVSIDIPANFVPNTSGLTNANVSGNTLTFDILGLADCAWFSIPFTFPGSTAAGTPIDFIVTLNNPNDTYLGNNTDTLSTVVLNSYDPNAKEVNHATNIDPSAQETLQYTIHFQNDGNYAASTVVIQDTLDADLDLASFEVLTSKHSVATFVNPTTRVVTFTFSDINLTPSSQDLDASQGFVGYSIRENVNLAVGTEIENTAYIYFDFNPAIVTNTTYNINSSLSVTENNMEHVGMYPNPAQSIIAFNGATVKTVSIYDLTGKVILNNQAVQANSLSITGLANGLYHVEIQTEKGTYSQKLVVRN